eukprot:TRINITY_DN34017_c0_g1_i1.p1 TRINITY_DN34017_c0_g1~~TRINITY_DN34017_c0_g1_i1.p1  ORF type:complete len:406 (+),score=55.85 TRINITY_DN34017_c0_g1_i1:70-1218(+)
MVNSLLQPSSAAASATQPADSPPCGEDVPGGLAASLDPSLDGGGGYDVGKADLPGKAKDKGSKRLEWWQRLNEVKPTLWLPEPQRSSPSCAVLDQEEDTMLTRVHTAVAGVAEARLSKGKDWLVRDADYGVSAPPAHAAVKTKVNAAIVKAIVEISQGSLPAQLAKDPRLILLLLETPMYGSLRGIVEAFPELRCCQQVVIPQADLGQYFEMVRGSEFYPGVRAQRLDHWLCANATMGLRCIAAFLDFECRLVGAMSARLCPAADVMRYFRFGCPAEPVSIFALTVGLEEPATTVEEVDAFVRQEARLNGYVAELRETWKYRMGTLLYVVRRVSSRSVSTSLEADGSLAAGTASSALPSVACADNAAEGGHASGGSIVDRSG